MKLIVSLILCLLSLPLLASQKELTEIPFHIDSVKKDPSLPINQSVFQITFKYEDAPVLPNHPIHYSCNGVTGQIQLDRSFTAKIYVKPGKNIFQFFLSDQYYEVYTDSIEFNPQERTFATLNWQRANRMIICDKPVIYLYPEETSEIEVKVKPKGKFTFTYPVLDEESWKIKSDPNGTITHDGESYNYLFWESAQDYSTTSFNKNEGFVINSQTALATLEKVLNDFGLNSKEKADFITYWGPKLAKGKHYIHFELNESCNQFAELEILPEPDHIFRIYILIVPMDEDENYPVQIQEIKKIDRSGFTVIEWGGSILDPSVIQPVMY